MYTGTSALAHALTLSQLAELDWRAFFPDTKRFLAVFLTCVWAFLEKERRKRSLKMKRSRFASMQAIDFDSIDKEGQSLTFAAENKRGALIRQVVMKLFCFPLHRSIASFRRVE